MADADWEEYGDRSFAMTRNLTIMGAFEDIKQWPVLNLGFVRGKIHFPADSRLAFNMTRLVVRNFREAPLFQAPGMDLAALTPSNPSLLLANVSTPELLSKGSPVPLATAYLYNAAVVQNTCLPPSMYSKSSAGAPRPPEVPGRQLAGRSSPFPNCINSSTVQEMQRCWPAQGRYEDFASYALDVQNNKQIPADYMLRVMNSYYLCEQVMTEECASSLGVLGCYLHMFPLTPADRQAYGSGAARSGDAVAGGSQSGSAGGNDGGGSTARLLEIILPSVLGGILVLAALAGLLLVLSKSRRTVPSCYGVAGVPGAKEQCASPSDHMPGGPDARELGGGTAGAASGASPTGKLSNQRLAPSPEPGVASTVLAPAVPASWNDLSLIPVTPLTPFLPDINLNLKMGPPGVAEVELTKHRLGAGAFGYVVRGLYGGVPVAVKLVKTGLRLQQHGVDGGPGFAASAPEPAAASAALHLPASAGADAEADVGAGDRDDDNKDGGDGGGGVDGGAPGGGAPQGPEAQTGEAQTRTEETDDLGACSEAGAVQAALLREVEVLARVQHPNIVRLLAASLVEPRICLVMELMDTSLDKMLYRNPGYVMPLSKVLNIMIQVSQALAYLHPTILHRDLKPANVLILNLDADKPVAKLADFGLSRLLDTVLLTKNPEVGTAPYMAPETFDLMNTVVTDRSDIYSLGVILFEVLSGQKPWEGCNIVQIAYAVTVLHGRPPIERVSSVRCPPKLRALIKSCWEPDPARRPAAAEVVKALVLVQQESLPRQHG